MEMNAMAVAPMEATMQKWPAVTTYIFKGVNSEILRDFYCKLHLF